MTKTFAEQLYRRAIKTEGWVLAYVPEKFKTPKLCLMAVKTWAGALEFVPKEFLFKGIQG